MLFRNKFVKFLSLLLTNSNENCIINKYIYKEIIFMEVSDKLLGLISGAVGGNGMIVMTMQ